MFLLKKIQNLQDSFGISSSWILFAVSQPGFTSSWKGYNPNKATQSWELGNCRVCKTSAARAEVSGEVRKNGIRTGKPLEFKEQVAKGRG